VWQQRNFREENVIGALPPLLRNAEDLEDIILDLTYQRTRPALQLHLFSHFLKGSVKKTWQADIIDLHNRPLFDGEFAQNDEDVRAYRMVLVSLSKTMRIYTGFLLGSICTHTNDPCSSMTGDRILVYFQPITDYTG
jgi:hypothetical protein